MKLVALASFNRVAAHGGFGQASRATGQSKATLSRHVRELEEQLGVVLMERSARSIRLTDEGAALHARTEGLLAEVEAAGSEISAGHSHARGTLRVSVPVLFADVVMGKLGAGFVARYPEVVLEITAEDRNVDLLGEAYDAVIRINPRPQPDLVGRCFLHDETVVVAPPSLARPAADPAARELRSISAVTLAGGLDAAIWNDFAEMYGHAKLVRPVLRLPSLLAVRDAVRAGAGIALLPRSIVAEDLASGLLVSWSVTRDRKVELWVLYPRRRVASRKVAAFTSFLIAAFPDRQRGLEAHRP